MPIRVPFSDVDHAGIVFFARVFSYCHLAFEQWYEAALGEPLSAIFTARGYATPVVATEASFGRPMRHGDRLRVILSAERVGTRSFTLGFRFLGEDGDERCRVRITHATVAFPGLSPIAVPEDLRGALSARASPPRS